MTGEGPVLLGGGHMVHPTCFTRPKNRPEQGGDGVRAGLGCGEGTGQCGWSCGVDEAG